MKLVWEEAPLAKHHDRAVFDCGDIADRTGADPFAVTGYADELGGVSQEDGHGNSSAIRAANLRTVEPALGDIDLVIPIPGEQRGWRA